MQTAINEKRDKLFWLRSANEETAEEMTVIDDYYARVYDRREMRRPSLSLFICGVNRGPVSKRQCWN